MRAVMLAYIKENFKYDLIEQDEQCQVYCIYNDNERYFLKVLLKGNYALETLRKIDNIHIPKINKVFTENEYTYVIEEYFEGNPIYKINELTEKMIINYILQICDGLKSLHDDNLVYRNIKLSSIIITNDNIVKLKNCETTQLIDKEYNKQDTRFIGDIGFAAPEQFSSTKTDIRSDIYSIGVLMRVLLDNMGKEEYNGKYNYIINKCVDFNPNYRFQTIEELKNEINNGYILEKQKKEGYSFMWKIYYYISYAIISLPIYGVFTYVYFSVIEKMQLGHFVELCLAVAWVISIFIYTYLMAIIVKIITKYQYDNRRKWRIYIYIINFVPFLFIIFLIYYYYRFLI